MRHAFPHLEEIFKDIDVEIIYDPEKTDDQIAAISLSGATIKTGYLFMSLHPIVQEFIIHQLVKLKQLSQVESTEHFLIADRYAFLKVKEKYSFLSTKPIYSFLNFMLTYRRCEINVERLKAFGSLYSE